MTRQWICQNGHINVSSSDRCQVCGEGAWNAPSSSPESVVKPDPVAKPVTAPASSQQSTPSEGDPQAEAVEQLLMAYRQARAKSASTRWHAEVINDIRRSATAARDALNAIGSPHAATVDTFLTATASEDSLLRIKRTADKGLAVADIPWIKLLLVAGYGLTLGLLLVAQLALFLVAALPIGLILTRAGWYGPSVAKAISGYMTRPNEGRELIDRLVLPAELRFFATVQGRRPQVRSTTVSGAAEKGVVGAVVAAALIGAGLGALVAAGF